MVKTKQLWAVALAILLGILAGRLSGTDGGIFGFTFYSVYDLVGSLFLRSLTLIVVPLVASSIISGIARAGSEKGFGRLGVKTLGFYVSTILLAILTGLLFVNLIEPGVAEKSLAAQLTQGTAMPQASAFSVREFLFQIVPSNIVDVFSKGQMLGLIFFSLLLGFAMARLPEKSSQPLTSFFNSLFQVMIQVTRWIMFLLPLGVFCLIAKTFATLGLESVRLLALFTVTVVAGLAVFMFGVLPLMLKLVGRANPRLHFKAMAPALLTAFSTSSSSATLPITIDCVEKRAGVSNRICSFVIPLGTSLNMSGSALYECVAAIFVAQVYGIDLSFTTQFFIVCLALITSMGVAGIPAASLVAVLIILKALGLPEEGLGLFIAVDRFLDMCRTTVNVFSDSCCAVLVAKTEGEKDVLNG